MNFSTISYIFARAYYLLMVSNNTKTAEERLTEYLLELCTSQGYLKGKLLFSEDLDGFWHRIAPSYYGDSVSEFNDYPEFSLACAGYLGMAAALLWDKDWSKYADVPYSFFRGPRGFDDMDDHITGTILKEEKTSVGAMQSCSTAAYHFLLKEGPEPGTAEAYKLFLTIAEVMFRTGAAIELNLLGYKLERI